MEAAAQAISKTARKHLRNTWVHRLPITSWAYKKMIHFAIPVEERSVDFRGKTLWVNTKDTSMVPSIVSGDYETFELDLYTQILKPNITVLDVGANIGIYSLLASDKSSKVYSFEPVPENLSLLKKSVASNAVEDKVHITPAAVGDKSGSVEIHIVPGSLGTHGVFADSTEKVEVKLITIDDFVKKKGLKVGLIKMDIEGYEPYAIRGAMETIKRQKPTIFMEFNATMIKNNQVDPLDFSRQLQSIYKYCYLIDDKKRRLQEINAETMSKLFNENVLLSTRAISI